MGIYQQSAHHLRFLRQVIGIIPAVSVNIANLPYAYKAAMNTLRARNAEAEKARQEQ